METKLVRTMKMSGREIAWVWRALSDEGVGFDECRLNTQLMRQQVAEYLTTQLLADLEHAKDTQFLAEDDFRWIAKEGRQPAWLLRKPSGL